MRFAECDDALPAPESVGSRCVENGCAGRCSEWPYGRRISESGKAALPVGTRHTICRARVIYDDAHRPIFTNGLQHMKITIIMLLVGASTGVTPLGAYSAPLRAGTAAMSGNRTDQAVLQRAAVRLQSLGTSRTIRTLRRNPDIQTAQMGRDGQTVDVRFRDGSDSLILPRIERSVSIGPERRLIRAESVANGPSGGKAAVWEPFATELGLGPSAGTSETQALQSAGFTVDSEYDSAVTVGLVASMAQYNVVYMHTHSGVSASGDGVVATGEPVNGDPSVAPLLADGSVIKVGVAGSTQTYYGITSKFISTHLGRFQPHALLFINGCALLSSSTFWQTLSAQGAGVLISWDQNAAAKDDFLSAAAFFNVMLGGTSVSDTLTTLRTAGYGTSSDNGVPASLGYVGDGAITLSATVTGGGTAPPPTVTAAPPTAAPPTGVPPTSTASPAPTSTIVPSQTSTPVPATSSPTPHYAPTPVSAQISLVSPIKPGKDQRIVVSRVIAGSPVTARVTYPNGQTADFSGTANASGTARITFVQHPGKLTRFVRTATVQITATTVSGQATSSFKYLIAFRKVDLVAPPSASVHGRVSIFVHAAKHRDVTVTIHPGHRKIVVKRGVTGDRGWLKIPYTIPAKIKPGGVISLHAQVRLVRKTIGASLSVLVD